MAAFKRNRVRQYRSIVLFRKGEKSFFVYGFAKSELGNIREDEVEQFNKMARYVLALTDAQLSELISSGQFEEVARDGQEISQWSLRRHP